MSISIITSDCILERKKILPPPFPSSSSSYVSSTLEKSHAWLKHMANVGGKKVPSKSSCLWQQSSCIYPCSLKVGIRAEELLLQNLLPFDRSFLFVVAMAVSSSLSSLEHYLILEGRTTFFLLKKRKSRRRMTVHAQLCMCFQFGSSNLPTAVLVQQYRSCTLQGRIAHPRMEPLPPSISAGRLNSWSRYSSSTRGQHLQYQKISSHKVHWMWLRLYREWIQSVSPPFS